MGRTLKLDENIMYIHMLFSPIENGEVKYEETTYKNIAIYTCLKGYTLKGNNERQCGSSGHWSGRLPV